MGYTHYFNFGIPKGIKIASLESAFQRAVAECAKVARVYNAECAESGDTDSRLSGYTAHTKPGAYGGIQLNGKGGLACESFELREHFRENVDAGGAFVKTNRNPYDTVVVACLAILKYRLGDAVNVSSDGYQDDWELGVNLARRVLRRKVPNPLQGKVWQRKAG